MKRILCVGAVWGDSRPTKYGISREQWFMAWSMKYSVALGWGMGCLSPLFWACAVEVPRFPLGPRRFDQSGFPL